VIICDTSGLIAGYDESDPDGPAIRELLDADAGSLIVSPFVLAEVDYMIMKRSGATAELVLLKDLADGVYQVAEFTQLDAERVAELSRSTPISSWASPTRTRCVSPARIGMTQDGYLPLITGTSGR
jgi:predicted nucleic acid-binding protein